MAERRDRVCVSDTESVRSGEKSGAREKKRKKLRVRKREREIKHAHC